MEIRKRLVRWRNSVRNFKWGDRRNKQLLPWVLPEMESGLEQTNHIIGTNSEQTKFPRPKWITRTNTTTATTTVPKAETIGNRLKRVKTWSFRKRKDERHTELQENPVTVPTECTLPRRPALLVLPINGLLPTRYSKLTNTTQDLNLDTDKPEMVGQQNTRISSSKWNGFTITFNGSKRTKQQNSLRMRLGNSKMLAEKREELHRYAFDNAALDLQSHSCDRQSSQCVQCAEAEN